MHQKPNIKFPLNCLARRVSPDPNYFDFLSALQIMYYCIGTKNTPRILGGKYGPCVFTK